MFYLLKTAHGVSKDTVRSSFTVVKRRYGETIELHLKTIVKHVTIKRLPLTSKAIASSKDATHLFTYSVIADWVLDLALKDFTDHRSTILHIRY